jgi:hypothetical protein
MKNIIVLILILLLLGIIPGNIAAQNKIPQVINYQGYLADENGQALNDSKKITFSIYDDSLSLYQDGGKWQEVHPSVQITNGLFNIMLGSVDTLTRDIFTGDLYLGVWVDGDAEEIKPRMRLASVPYSLHSEHANKATEATEASYAHVLSAPDNDPLESVVVDNDGKVGIGTGNPQAKLDVAGGIFVHGSAPFQFRRYSYANIPAMNNAITVDYNTGWNSADWAAAIVGYDAGWGDLMESDNQRLWKIQMVADGGTWRLRLAAPTHGGKHPDWIVDVMFIKKELVSSDY